MRMDWIRTRSFIRHIGIQTLRAFRRSCTGCLYDWMTGHDFVSTLARLHGMTREEASERASHVLDFVGLADVQNKEIGKYSKGMRQRE